MTASAAERNLVNLSAACMAYGTRTLLDNVSLGVSAGDRIGVVGRNGDGKTTLVSLLAGAMPPDAGRVVHRGGLRVGFLAQQDRLPERATVRRLVLGDLAEHEWAGDAGVREVLAGLFGGLDLPDLRGGLDTPVGQLSGGERRRVALATLLVGDHDLLVLDEPINHLDIAGIDWMTRHLVSYPAARRAALVVVTHDRSLLDTVCTQTWEVHGGQVHAYNGGYSSYVLAKAERARLAEAVEQRRRNLLRKELAWLRRGPPARTSKPRFRIEAANTLIAGEPPPRDAAELVRFASARLGKTVYELHDTTLRRGERTVLDRMTWQLGPGDRIGLVGVNGSGKTSVLRMLHGELPPSAGRLVTGKTVRPAYLPQETSASQAGEADRSLRALEAVQAVRRTARLGKGQEFSATQLLERFGFTGERQRTRVGDLSGGERRRLQLLRLLMTEPNVLLLDEPTNDLDVETLTVLEDLLDGWPGSLVVVSHDRYFLERVCDRVVALLGDGRLRLLPGGVAEYLERRRATGAAAPHAPPAPRRPGDTRAAQRETRKELTRLERRLDTLAQREKRLHEEMAEHATDPGRLAELDAGLRALLADKHRVEERWLALAEQEDPS